MEKSFLDLIRLVLPLGKERRSHLAHLAPFIEVQDVHYLKQLLKLRRIGVSYATLGVSKRFVEQQGFPRIDKAVPDAELDRLVRSWNKRIVEQATQQAFVSFASQASDVFPRMIAPQLVGFDVVKQVAAWQLFGTERFHLLLLGDPGTGKTEILRGVEQLAPVSSFGLGSGTSSVGLSVAKKGKELVKGLLPLAHKGICCIDELNLLRQRDQGALLNAMEKGFVSFDKGDSHAKLPAEVRVLATANPKGDRFIGEKVSFLRKQLPFDPALLSRFHLVFLIRRPSKEEFLRITKRLLVDEQHKLSVEDVSFLKQYVAFAAEHKVVFEKKFEPIITDFFDELKSREEEFLVELSPRLVLGVVRMCKARARMRLAASVTREDVVAVLDALKASLAVGLDSGSKRLRS